MLKKWTMPRNYFGEEWPEFFVGLSQTRDSDCLERSNFACFLAGLGGESETVLVIREGHWACGWVEWIAIHQDATQAIEKAEKMMERLEDYSVLNEDDFSEREEKEAGEVWKDCYSVKERIEYIRGHSSQFDFRDFSDLRACVRGEYFAGIAGELPY
jgi:hypothetical protein